MIQGSRDIGPKKSTRLASIAGCSPYNQAMTSELKTIIDHIRYGASRFNAAGLSFGHSFDNALDEATQLVLHALHLPHDLSPVYGQSRLTGDEKAAIHALFERRIRERKPACYLTGEAWFAGLSFKADERALVPRSPIAELIEADYEPWRAGRPIERVLDLCTGGGCIAIATAHHLPDALVDGVDISEKALALAAENAERLQVADRVRLIQSDLFSALEGERYDLIVTNPPYVTKDEVAALPDEYRHEPENGLIAGDDGLDLALRILRDAPAHLNDGGFLICEVGESEHALVRLLPQVPFVWVEFKVGQMGIFVIEREDLMTWHIEISALAAEREAS
jgi:ribosomal protein L3 glutamine methyltransferase